MRRGFRTLSIIVSVALFAVIVIAVRERGRPLESIRLVQLSSDVMRFLTERAEVAAAGFGLTDAEPAFAATPDGLEWAPLRRTPISPELAARFQPTLAMDLDSKFPRSVYDPRAYFVHAPGWTGSIKWDEHPWRRWRIKYSQAGFRNPYEPADPPPDLRIILCGDSHMEGVVPYVETTSAVLERTLIEQLGGQTVEVLNAATGGHDIYNYVGQLERSLSLRPNVFLLVIYGGNDFVGLLPLHAYFERIRMDWHDHELRERMTRGAEESPGAMGQALHQILNFQMWPRNADIALDGAIRAMRDMDAFADKAGIALISAYLPPQIDVRPQDARAEIEKLQAMLELSEEDLRITDRLADEFIARLAAIGQEVIDLRPALREASERVYWASDHHLNSHGHAVVAQELLPHLLERATAPR